jgi:8-oxo-dGTP pyrophosphatase MutT (NUDIX family)
MILDIAAAILSAPDGRTLLVRKRGAGAFMQAGGKIEPGEDPRAALCRELAEELALHIAPDMPAYVGRFEAPAANEPGYTVSAEIYRIALTETALRPAAEIAEIAWVDPRAPGLPLAPLTRDHILPLA